MVRTLLLLSLLLSWMPACAARPSHAHLALGNSEDQRAEALKRLLQVFGITDPPQSLHGIKQPPQYMVDLYNTVAGADGVTKDPDILEGNTVRSFLDKFHSGQMHFLFILSSVAKNERVLTAELHLFKLRARMGDGPLRRHHFCQVSVYQILDQHNLDSPDGKKLLSARLLAVQGSGWEVFSITQAVRDWTEEESSNQGLLVTVRGLGGAVLDPSAVQFASGRDHHESKKPMLVLFTDDGRRGAALPTNTFSDMALENPYLPEEIRIPQINRTRPPRSAGEQQLPCQIHPLSVDFEEIGWSGWIISPRGYNAFHCRGSCPFPLGENMRPTNHATVQSIINALKLSQDVSGPCCVPDKLFSINLLYFDDDENVVLKQYDDMVAGSCGCH
ncbi:bone morphogenetic protein 2-like [Eublepharis macularius]|uniref:Bone morphogenetic protein 2-like n=1 Tax=Eublepharis macularius TaxID=481883 RepID=A0AA97JDH8_EUBMA|nr:bone morphogenetic protein 2-like [Eublepharis macularius]